MTSRQDHARETICVISDGSGITAERVLHAALAQFHGVEAAPDVVSHVSDARQIAQAVEETAARRGLIVYTLVEAGLRNAMAACASETGVPAVDVLGPLMHALTGFLASPPRGKAGLRLDRATSEHYRRLEAVSFTVTHDDGLGIDGLDQAQIVIVGPSRTSKTPLSAYLAHTRGLKVANVPLALGLEPPAMLRAIPQHRIVGLTMNSRVLAAIREKRALDMGAAEVTYAALPHVQEELRFCHAIYRTPPEWPVIDVTGKSIEEVAAAVCALTVDAPVP